MLENDKELTNIMGQNNLSHFADNCNHVGYICNYYYPIQRSNPNKIKTDGI